MGIFRKKGQEKLYKQWVKYGDLPPDAVPQEEEGPKHKGVPAFREKEREEVPIGRDKGRRDNLILYVGLGVAVTVLCVGVVLLLIQSC